MTPEQYNDFIQSVRNKYRAFGASSRGGTQKSNELINNSNDPPSKEPDAIWVHDGSNIHVHRGRTFKIAF